MAGLTDRQRRAIAALLTTRTVVDAAEQCGVGLRTLERWRSTAAFRDAYTAASRDRLAETVARLRAASAAALETLQAALAEDSPSVRVRAAQVLLDCAVKVEVDDLARRIEALEEAQRV